MRPSRRAFARKSPPSSVRSAGTWTASFRPRCSAARATASSCSPRAVAEPVTIARMGHRGDGIAQVRDRIVDIDRCPVLAPALDGAIDAAWDLAEILKLEGKPLDIQVTATQSGLDVDLRGSGPLPAAAMTRLAHAADAHRLARLTRHGEL